MGDKSGIQWTDATWNPTTGCDRVSPGCANCYALTMAARLKRMGQSGYQRDGDPRTSGPGFGFTEHPDRLDQPLRWRRPRRIFVDSMSDLFHADASERFLDRVFAVMALAPRHTFQVLTKRPERMREYFADVAYRTEQIGIEAELRSGLARYDDAGAPTWPLPLPNVWLGTSVENARWRSRIAALRDTPAVVRFLSCEPLLGPLVSYQDDGTGGTARRGGFDLDGIDWLIVGGESGKGARPMSVWWVRDIVAQCREQGVAPFVKQLGEIWSREHVGHAGHAGKADEWPEDLRVREFPAAR